MKSYAIGAERKYNHRQIPASYSADGILPGSSSKIRYLVINLASVPDGQLANSPTAQGLGRCRQPQWVKLKINENKNRHL